MIYGTTKATEIKQDKMKIALVGEPKVGKDWLACSAPGTIFSFDFDDRKDSLATHPNKANIEVKTYQDKNSMKALAWSEFTRDVDEFQEMKQRNEVIPDWFVLSSAQFMQDAVMNKVLQDNKGMRYEMKIGEKIVSYTPFGFDPYGICVAEIQNALGALHSISNVIMTFHETPERDKINSTKKEVKYTGKLDVYPVNLKKLLPLFDNQWRLITFGGTRKLITDISDSQFNGSSTLSVAGEINNPNLSAMIAEHLSSLTK
jgi:hypothetical protein